MNKYQKIIDYEKHEAKYYENVGGVIVEVSKDIVIDEYDKEIQRLNNIIDELEKYIEYSLNNPLADEMCILKIILAKLKELKEDVK